MKDNIMKLSELGILLEYEDERSIINWCGKNKIPVIDAGKAKYVISTFIDLYFENAVAKFVNAKYENPTEILEAISQDNKSKLSELVKAPMSKKVQKDFEKKEQRSKASQDFLKQFKAA